MYPRWQAVTAALVSGLPASAEENAAKTLKISRDYDVIGKSD
jgi:hypothetical protein